MVDAKIGLTIYLLKPDKVAAFEDELKPGRDVRPLAEPLDGEFIPLPSAVGDLRKFHAVRTVHVEEKLSSPTDLLDKVTHTARLRSNLSEEERL